MSLTALFGALFFAGLLPRFGYNVPQATVQVVLVGVFLIVFGNLLGKVRPNWSLGMRNRWTLSSKVSWDRTNRLAGWLFSFCGLASIVAAFRSWALGVIVLIASTLLTVLILLVRSSLAWRVDPVRIPPAGTTPAE